MSDFIRIALPIAFALTCGSDADLDATRSKVVQALQRGDERTARAAISEARAASPNTPESIVENLYGPTELTISCTVHRWDSDTSPGACVDGLVPIGRPHEGLALAIVDESLTDVTEGELCVAGPQNFPGYWQRSDLTAARTFERQTGDSARSLYRTGDRVRRASDGELVYLGRLDQQVKVLGHRVELGELERVLEQHQRIAVLEIAK